MKSKKTQGRLNRQSGSIWELKVREDLIKKGWNVSKFQNNVELTLIGSKGKIKYHPSMLKHTTLIAIEGKLIPAKMKYNPFRKAMMLSSGFPDFICWKLGDYADIEIEAPEFKTEIGSQYGIVGIEAKSKGYLDKIERAKCRWLIENKVFSKILVASKHKNGRRIEIKYKEFQNA